MKLKIKKRTKSVLLFSFEKFIEYSNLPYHKHLSNFICLFSMINFNQKSKQMTKIEIMKYEIKECKNKVRSKELKKEQQ